MGHFCYCSRSLLIFYGDSAMMPCAGISSMHSEVKGKSPYQFQVLISSCLAFWISLSIFFCKSMLSGDFHHILCHQYLYILFLYISISTQMPWGYEARISWYAKCDKMLRHSTTVGYGPATRQRRLVHRLRGTSAELVPAFVWNPSDSSSCVCVLHIIWRLDGR